MTNTPDIDFIRLCEGLRSELRAFAANGQLDADCAAGVGEEITEADACLPMTDGRDRRQFGQTMGRLAGLVEGASGLSARVDEVAAAIPGDS